MRAIVVEKGRPAELRELDEPVAGPGDVLVDVSWSGVNYKDGLALRGDPGVARADPLVPGIDLVGVVASSGSPRFRPGDQVLVNGAGHGETRPGGFAERVVVDPDVAILLPRGIDARRAAAIGTAGFTAMLSVLRLERDVRPGDGDVVVTGAAGGVGSVAIAVLSRLGYSVSASSGRVVEQGDYLRSLGASDLIDRDELSGGGKAMQRARWAGGVDSVGSHTLATVLAQTRWGGTVTACGLAQGSDLPTTVLPFILRGVTLAGVNSVEAPLESRERAWRRLAADLDLDLLDSMTREVALDDVVGAGDDVLAGRTRGRTVVRVGTPRIWNSGSPIRTQPSGLCSTCRRPVQGRVDEPDRPRCIPPSTVGPDRTHDGGPRCRSPRTTTRRPLPDACCATSSTTRCSAPSSTAPSSSVSA